MPAVGSDWTDDQITALVAYYKELVKGKGAGLPDPALGSLPFPVRAQLLNSDTGICWESTFNSAIDNDANQFKAKVAN